MLNFLQANNIMDMAWGDEKFKSMIGEQLDIQGKLKPAVLVMSFSFALQTGIDRNERNGRHFDMGLFSKKKNEVEKLEEITPALKAKLDELAEKGNQFEEEEQYEEAIQAWEEGLNLIPEPQQYYSETIWFLAAIGDVYFKKGMYPQAHKCFDKARGNLSGDGYGNPFIMLRLGECCLEIGDEKNAIEYLLRAYMMEGKEIFEPDENGEDDGQKYFDFLRTHVEHIK